MHHINNIIFRSINKQIGRVFHAQRLSKCLSTIERPPELKLIQQLSIPQGILGQPTCHTHPHLIKPGHLTCGTTQLEYKERREFLVAKLISESQITNKTHIIVIPAARKQHMTDKIPYVFRQNSDFYYLTGCLEPSAVMVLVKNPRTDNFKTILFVHEKDQHAELWEGPRTGCKAAATLFAVDETRPVENFDDFLKKIVTKSKPIVLWYNGETLADESVQATMKAVLHKDSMVSTGDPQTVLHFMRVVKSPTEVELMKETCYIGAQSVNHAMACTKPGVSEHQITALLEYSCKQAGAEHLAFPPVVAGGARATHIHYVVNNQLLTGGEMVLVDTGCQRWLYNSDISRTWPVSGKFSTHQRILYELVLTVQKRLIELLGENRPSLDQLFDQMCRLLGLHLQQEGILPKNIDGNELLSKAYRLCPHHVAHYLGLDVHDSSLVRRRVPVATNMVVTVEPGIYIAADDTSVPKEFRGIGIRIEDDVLITDGEPLVLTDSCVKEVQDIEAIVGKHNF